MKPNVSIGAQSFEFIRKNKSFFVDKTDFIREWWENADAVTLITRPRRFGKTLNLNMLDCFFSRSFEGRSDLFEGLSIWKNEKYRRLQGSYPVIFLSFADVKGANYRDTREGIIHTIAGVFREYDYLLEKNILNESEKQYFTSLKEYAMNPSVSKMMDDTFLTRSLNELSSYLYRCDGKKVLIFLDEYDTPLQEAYVHGYWDELAALTRSLFNSTFKTNPYMERAIMTGITRVSKESIFSDLNNLTVVTTTSDKYNTQFGFTEEEVFQALDAFGMPEEKERVKEWYDGFTFGSQKDIYNPWSITSFLDEKQYKPYWVNSSSNQLVSTLIQQGNIQNKMIMEDLLAGKPLITEIDEEIIFNQLQKKRGAIWSMFLASGYLKVTEKSFSESTGRFTYQLQITNREVKLMFENMIRDWFSGEDVPYNEFMKSFLSGDIKAMNHYMNRIALDTFSFFDTGRNPSEKTEPERFYHGFVLGLIAELAGKYRITSNRESGFGRYDVMMEPCLKDEPAFVLEFKVHEPGEGTLEETLKEALQQIEEKGYDNELMTRGITRERIRHYGFAFEGKHVLIG